MTVELRKYDLLPAATREQVSRLLAASYDTVVAGCHTPDDFLGYMKSEPGFWAIMVGGAPAGVFALGRMPGQTHFDTTTVLFSEHRGTGLNAPFKRAVAEAARDTGLPLASFVKTWNERSIRATARAFPGVTPVPVELVSDHGTEAAWLYDLGQAPRAFVEPSYVPVYETIALWVKARCAAYTRA